MNDNLSNNVFSPRKKLRIKNKKVLVALSGGVDSSVAAALLKKQGYSVEGAYMVCWTTGPYCTTEKDRADAARVSAHLGIPFRVFDFEKEYKKTVIDYFFSEYEAGRTPNPDVMCNREIKFGLFLKKALYLGFDYIATGHYARIKKYQVSGINYQEGNGNGRSGNKISKDQSLVKYHLYAGSDPDKDQSYFLYTLNQKKLAKSLFPVGDYPKGEIRKIARKLGLPTADKPDSQGICFVGPVDVNSLLRNKIKTKSGKVVDLNDNVLGKHDGLAFYTIGQREGIGISKSIPHYVVEKRFDTNQLVLAPIGAKELFKDSLEASRVSWVTGKPKIGKEIKVRIRYRQPLVDATIQVIEEDKMKVQFADGQKAVTPGQSIVFYQDDEVLGGAIIDS